jgi:hypothetical protein
MKQKGTGLQVFVAIILAVLLVFIINLGISLFYPYPSYDSGVSVETYYFTTFWVLVGLGAILSIAGLLMSGLLFNIIGLAAGGFLVLQGAWTVYSSNKIPSFIALIFVFIILIIFSYQKWFRKKK